MTRHDDTAARSEIRSIAITDCGSTTTKAILIEKLDGKYRHTYRGDAPTTVEAPVEDVTSGVIASFRDLSEISGRRIVDEHDVIVRPCRNGEGIDLYLSTSSAGGGLQMLVAGIVAKYSVESAKRAALGAGAIVADTVAFDNRAPLHEQIDRVRKLRPDMVLLAGGTEGGARIQIAEIAELLAAAAPRPRFGEQFRLPVIFAGNREATEDVRAILGDSCALYATDNVRPAIESEQLAPARERIHELFLDHVMRQAPGFSKLLELTDAPVMPTPSAVGAILQTVAERQGINVLCVDIGGATTDIFSVVDGRFTRTVSANLGMSYSATYVLQEAGPQRIARWLPFDIDERDLYNDVMNKTIRPTTIPDTLEDLLIEQALAREALRLSMIQHQEFATELTGARRDLNVDSAFEPLTTRTFVHPMKLDLLIGSGGVLSHAPRLEQTALMLVDSFEPQGVTRLAKDSIFMLPHLGVLSSILPEAAHSVFEEDCLVELGTCIAPVSKKKVGQICLEYDIRVPGGTHHRGTLRIGELARLPLTNETAEAILEPVRGCDVGAGPGKTWRGELRGGAAGIILDGRGRPLPIPAAATQAQTMRKAMVTIGALEDETSR